jgi:hypothetical protein
MSSLITAPFGGLFSIDYLGYEKVNYKPQTVLVNLCNDADDKYLFGYNTQLKMNEIAGIGNWNTAEFWEYSTRTGVRANPDPKPHIGVSDYSVMGGNPIANADPNGDYFFGLVGSTSSQRKEAKEFAKQHNGVVKDINKKSIHVDYTGGGKTQSYYPDDEEPDGYSYPAYECQRKQMYFQKNGKQYDPNAIHGAPEPNVMAQVKANFWGNLLYQPVNTVSTFGQQLTSGIRSADYIFNLDGSAYESNGPFDENERINGSVDAVMMFFPSAKAVNGLGYLKKLNAAQFSKTFKGNLSKLKPSLRGKTNRFANYMIEKWNEYIPSGTAVKEAAGSLKEDDSETEK